MNRIPADICARLPISVHAEAMRRIGRITESTRWLASAVTALGKRSASNFELPPSGGRPAPIRRIPL